MPKRVLAAICLRYRIYFRLEAECRLAAIEIPAAAATMMAIAMATMGRLPLPGWPVGGEAFSGGEVDVCALTGIFFSESLASEVGVVLPHTAHV